MRWFSVYFFITASTENNPYIFGLLNCHHKINSHTSDSDEKKVNGLLYFSVNNSMSSDVVFAACTK